MVVCEVIAAVQYMHVLRQLRRGFCTIVLHSISQRVGILYHYSNTGKHCYNSVAVSLVLLTYYYLKFSGLRFRAWPRRFSPQNFMLVPDAMCAGSLTMKNLLLFFSRFGKTLNYLPSKILGYTIRGV